MNEPKSNPALTKALGLLSKRSYSKAILVDKLKDKKFALEDIDEAVKKLEALNFIDDKRYAESLVREYSSLRRYGAGRIKLKLREKKISQEIILEVLESISDQTEQDNLDALAQKQLEKNKNLPREKLINRTLGYLLRRGYSYDKCKKIINNYLGK